MSLRFVSRRLGSTPGRVCDRARILQPTADLSECGTWAYGAKEPENAGNQADLWPRSNAKIQHAALLLRSQRA